MKPNKDAFWELKGPEGRIFRVVPEDVLVEMLDATVSSLDAAFFRQSGQEMGEQIKGHREREDCGLSQPELARRAQITQAQLSKIETGKVKRPHRATINRLFAEIALERKTRRGSTPTSNN